MQLVFKVSIGSGIFFTAHRRVSSGMPRHVLSPKNCVFTFGDLDPHLIRVHDSFGPPESSTQTASPLHWFNRFCAADRSVPILYNGPPLLPSKLLLPMGEHGPPSITWFFRPTRVLNPNGISIGSAVFCRAHYCDRQTDRETTLLGR